MRILVAIVGIFLAYFSVTKLNAQDARKVSPPPRSKCLMKSTGHETLSVQILQVGTQKILFTTNSTNASVWQPSPKRGFLAVGAAADKELSWAGAKARAMVIHCETGKVEPLEVDPQWKFFRLQWSGEHVLEITNAQGAGKKSVTVK